MSDVYIAGAAVTPFGKFPATTIADLANQAVDAALVDAGVDAQEVGFVAFGNAAASVITGQAMIQGQLALAGGQLAGAQIVNIENACASSSTALQLAIMAVRSGQTDVAMAVGVEKMTSDDKSRAFAALGTAIDVADPSLAGDSSTASSVFMNLYAKEARSYQQRTGAPAEAFAHAAATAHFHGSLNPNAQYHRSFTPQQVLESRMIDDPLTLLMCSPIGDGAAAVIVTNRRPAADPVLVRAAALRSGRPREGGAFITRVADLAFGQAGITPAQVDVIELHDAAASAALVILEELRVLDHGAAWKVALDGDLRFDGRLPVNTGGGLIARGHPIGATGCAQIVELTDQLRGRAAGRQVRGPRFALAQNAGGAVTITDPYTAAVCTVTILEAL